MRLMRLAERPHDLKLTVPVGVLGFIPGITTNYDMMTFAGHHSEAKLLGLFDISVLHNIVHLAFGVAGLALAGTFDGARGFSSAAGPST